MFIPISILFTGTIQFTIQDDSNPPSSVLTVIIAEPDPTAVTNPASDTVAISWQSEDQITFLFVASVGAKIQLFS